MAFTASLKKPVTSSYMAVKWASPSSVAFAMISLIISSKTIGGMSKCISSPKNSTVTSPLTREPTMSSVMVASNCALISLKIEPSTSGAAFSFGCGSVGIVQTLGSVSSLA